jgi:hypothetical protein
VVFGVSPRSLTRRALIPTHTHLILRGATSRGIGLPFEVVGIAPVGGRGVLPVDADLPKPCDPNVHGDHPTKETCRPMASEARRRPSPCGIP